MKFQALVFIAIALLSQASSAGEVITAKCLKQPDLITIYGHHSSGVAPRGFQGIQIIATDGRSYDVDGKTTSGNDLALKDDCLYSFTINLACDTPSVDEANELKCGLSFPQEH